MFGFRARQGTRRSRGDARRRVNADLRQQRLRGRGQRWFCVRPALGKPALAGWVLLRVVLLDGEVSHRGASPSARQVGAAVAAFRAFRAFGPIFDGARVTESAPLSGRMGSRRDPVELRWRAALHSGDDAEVVVSQASLMGGGSRARASDTRGGLGNICDKYIPTGCQRRLDERVQPVFPHQARTRGRPAGGAASTAEHAWLSVGGLQHGRCHDSRGPVRAVRRRHPAAVRNELRWPVGRLHGGFPHVGVDAGAV